MTNNLNKLNSASLKSSGNHAEVECCLNKVDDLFFRLRFDDKMRIDSVEAVNNPAKSLLEDLRGDSHVFVDTMLKWVSLKVIKLIIKSWVSLDKHYVSYLSRMYELSIQTVPWIGAINLHAKNVSDDLVRMAQYEYAQEEASRYIDHMMALHLKQIAKLEKTKLDLTRALAFPMNNFNPVCRFIRVWWRLVMSDDDKESNKAFRDIMELIPNWPNLMADRIEQEIPDIDEHIKNNESKINENIKN